MTSYSDYVYYEGSSDPVVGVVVAIMVTNTQTPATLYTSGGVVTTAPVITGVDGSFTIYIDPGTYDFYVQGELYQTLTINLVEIVATETVHTPIDQSGAALVLTGTVYQSVTQSVSTRTGQIHFPVNSDGLGAMFGTETLYNIYDSYTKTCEIGAGTGIIGFLTLYIYNPGGGEIDYVGYRIRKQNGTQYTNAELSNINIYF